LKISTATWKPSRQLRSCGEERIDPPKDVLLTHVASHPLHAPTALSLTHTECPHNCVRHLLNIIRIDQQGIGFELLGCAGELAQDQCTVLIDAACAILLCDEIHPILEWCDESDVACAIVREKFFAIQPAKMILHRDRVAAGEPAIDVADQPVNATFELVIFWNFNPARHDHLDEHDTAA